MYIFAQIWEHTFAYNHSLLVQLLNRPYFFSRLRAPWTPEMTLFILVLAVIFYIIILKQPYLAPSYDPMLNIDRYFISLSSLPLCHKKLLWLALQRLTQLTTTNVVNCEKIICFWADSRIFADFPQTTMNFIHTIRICVMHKVVGSKTSQAKYECWRVHNIWKDVNFSTILFFTITLNNKHIIYRYYCTLTIYFSIDVFTVNIHSMKNSAAIQESVHKYKTNKINKRKFVKYYIYSVLVCGAET